MMIIDRPPDFSALAANSRAMRIQAWAGTLVTSACHAGVYALSTSSYPSGQIPGIPGLVTPYWANIRS